MRCQIMCLAYTRPRTLELTLVVHRSVADSRKDFRVIHSDPLFFV